MKKEYKKDDLTVVWEQGKCKHSAVCVKGSPGVFKPKERPWIQLENDDTDSIEEVVSRCPSGALTSRREK